MQSLRHFISALCRQLAKEQHILVFCSPMGNIQAFTVKARCAIYYRNLCEAENNRVSSCFYWNSGETKVMTYMTAFVQSMNRSFIWCIMIFKPLCSLVVNNQILGHTGKDRKSLTYFFLLIDVERYIGDHWLTNI